MNNPEPADTSFRALPDHAVVSLEGRDAIAFAQAQCMNDVGLLADGQWQWSGWLTPKGRVIALFALLRRNAESLWLILPDGDPRELAARLQRFVFRSKVVIAVQAELSVTGAFARPAHAAGAAAELAADATELDLGAAGGERTLRIARNPERRDDNVDIDSGHLARWKAFDLLHGLPRLSDAQREHWTPQQLSLERLQAYSVKKGCYPGQEIVARTHFLGGAARRGLVALWLRKTAVDGDEVTQAAHVIGQVISVAPRPQGMLALAVMPLERNEDDALQVAGVAEVESLLPGLAR